MQAKHLQQRLKNKVAQTSSLLFVEKQALLLPRPARDPGSFHLLSLFSIVLSPLVTLLLDCSYFGIISLSVAVSCFFRGWDPLKI